jgi:hypothetical protein
MRPVLVSLLLLFVGFGSPVSVAQRKEPLTNQDIIEMTKGGLGDVSITTAIETNETNFDTGPQALIKLKISGVTDSVLSAMQKGKARFQGADLRKYPSEEGIYVEKGGQLAEVGAEIVNYRTGGTAEKLLTGLDKGHTNGVVNGAHSTTQVKPRCEFVIVTLDGITPSEYLLVRLDEKKDRREFRQETIHMFSKSSGPGRNAVQFEFHTLAPRTYRININDLAQGEYGFLPPVGVDNRNAQANGRIFTFSVD